MSNADPGRPVPDPFAAPDPTVPSAQPVSRPSWMSGLAQGPSWLPAAQGPTQPTVLPPLPAVAQPLNPVEPPRHRRRVAVVVLAVLLVATLATGGVTVAYLLRSTSAWRESSAQWEHLAREHGAEVAQVQSDLTTTKEQLATAQERITRLADEKAQLGDESAATQQLADYQARISRAAGGVATSLATCIDGQENLIGYLQNPDLYDATDLAKFRTDVESYCGAARDANAALQAELTR